MKFHPHSQERIENFLANPSHAVLISGDIGAGKSAAAQYIGERLLNLENMKIHSYPYFRHVVPVDNRHSIEAIRNLHEFLRLKTLGKDRIRRVVLIEDAHAMSNEAQNALLKSLEEPPDDTVIILTAPKSMKLLDTIYSRVQQIAVLPATFSLSKQIFNTIPDMELEKAYMMSGGLVGLMHAITHDAQHPLLKEIQFAKNILSSSAYERLLTVETLSKDKPQLGLLLQALRIISSSALNKSAKQNAASSSQWLNRLNAVYKSEAAYALNPNAKLLLTDLMLQL